MEYRAPQPVAGRVAWLRGSRIDWLAGQLADGPVTVLVPAEQILLLGVDLPAQRRRERMAALPWAVEDAVIEPVSALHLALGAEIAFRRHLVASVRHAVMRDWCAALESAGLRRCRLVPDALALPPAPEGAWSVGIDNDRILVRGDPSIAFAIKPTLFASAWESAGRPPIVLHGDQAFPEDILAGPIPPQTVFSGDGPLDRLLADGSLHQPFDLAQGLYAPEADAGLIALRRIAAVLAAGLLAYVAILAADTAAIVHLANRRAVEAARLHAQIVAVDHRSGNIAADIAALTRIAVAPHSVFLPLMAKAATALHPFAGEISLRDLVFSSDDGTLNFGLQIRDFAALQRVEAALVASGIAVETGPATAAAGGVEAKVKLRAGASR